MGWRLPASHLQLAVLSSVTCSLTAGVLLWGLGCCEAGTEPPPHIPQHGLRMWYMALPARLGAVVFYTKCFEDSVTERGDSPRGGYSVFYACPALNNAAEAFIFV